MQLVNEMALENLTGDDEKFFAAVQSGDYQTVQQMLVTDKSLAGRNFLPESLHTDGFPLYVAAKNLDFDMVQLLLESAADPDAKLDVDDPRETGMPLIFGYEGNRLDIVNLLLDYDPMLEAHGYCSTPFVDMVFNSFFDRPAHRAEVEWLFRKSLEDYLGDCDDTDQAAAIGESSNTHLQLLSRIIEMGGRPSLFTVVRHQQIDLLQSLLQKCPTEAGTEMDWPRGVVFRNIRGAASWTGYPEVLELCRSCCPALYTEDEAKHAIESAIRSHNRDGGIDDYHQLIENELKFLRQRRSLTTSFSDGDPFLPLHWLAEDFIEPKNYGFRCERLSTPDDLIRLAKLFVEFGYDPNVVNPKTERTAMATAQHEQQLEYVAFLESVESN